MDSNSENIKGLSLNEKEIRLFCSFIEREAGLKFNEPQSQSALEISILNRIKEQGFRQPLDYLDHLSYHDEENKEFRELLELLTIKESSFFRNYSQFEALRDHILPILLESKRSSGSDKVLRVWSAGCASGEEPYSILMAIKDQIATLEDWKIEIQATDISENALVAAQNGIYRRRSIRSLPDVFCNKYFKRRPDDTFELSESIKKRVTFSTGNLIQDSPPFDRPCDIIFCRNVLIYFSNKSIRSILKKFDEYLSEDGFLFVGHSEYLPSFSKDFRAVPVKDTFVYIKSSIGIKNETRLTSEHISSEKSIITKDEKTRVKEKVSSVVHKDEQARKEEIFTDEILAQAREAFHQDDFEGSERLLHILLEKKPGLEAVHLLLACIYAATGKESDAIREVQLVLDNNYLCAGAHYFLGLLDQEKGEKKGAVQWFTRAIYSDNLFSLPHFHLALIFQEQGDLKQAERHFKNTLKALESSENEAWNDFFAGFPPELVRKSCITGLELCRGNHTN